MPRVKTPPKDLNRKRFLAKLASSGLTEAQARSLEISFEEDGGKRHSGAIGAPVLVLSYLDMRGKRTGFYRIRLLSDPPGFAGTLEKRLRYLQPPGTGVAAYLPRVLDWAAIAADVARPLYVTEGELKAACAAVRGLATIGLGGVYSWRSARQGHAFLPELAAFEWSGRHVFLLFDSDAQTNHHVMQALHHLCKELTLRGAIPYVCRLPQLPGQAKTGLDDFLIARGVDGLSEVVADAERFSQADALWELNDETCFVRDPGLVVELATGMRMSVASFAKEVYANRFYVAQEATARGEPKLVRKATAVEWVRWAHRLEAKRITYAPGQPPLTADGELNTWRGACLEPAAGDVAPWRELLDLLFGDDPAARTWFERWCAYPLRHPGAKLLTAVVLWGVHQGTGKSLVGYTLARLYGAHNASEITQEHLRSTYNDWLVDKQLVLGEEITGSDRRADADRLKAMITAKTVRVSSKYVREYTVPAVANFFFTSNHPDAFFLEDTDRRFFVHEVRVPPREMAFYHAYVKWHDSRAGQAALLDHLLRLDLGDFDPDGPALETGSKRDMIEDNKSDLAAWVARLKREPRSVLREAGLPEDVALMSAAQLRAVYDPTNGSRVTVNGLGRELKRSRVPRLGLVNLQHRDGTRTTARLYALQDAAAWERATPAAVAAAWQSWFAKA